ncbi:AfsR/SARP family transcriptional regulator [Streptomyces sp. NPDC046909]|uniref:AfsR/SARP family transcriptional regulator n=1 Tax=Streptomyces sp. NPDC046909 TaxID=3155617 RepID=UPI0033D2A206
MLGPLQVKGAYGQAPLRAHKQQLVLARLLCTPNQVITVPELVDTLWGASPPRTAEKVIQVYVHALRKTIRQGTGVEADWIRFVNRSGYTFGGSPSEIDVYHFDHYAKRGLGALAEGRDPRLALSELDKALRIWRGPALQGLTEPLFLSRFADALHERHLAVLEARIEAEIELGRHALVVHELVQLIADHPLREGLHAQLMIALYRSGRQGEALKAYQDVRRLLTEELGVEPVRRLRDLHRAILNHDLDLIR